MQARAARPSNQPDACACTNPSPSSHCSRRRSCTLVSKRASGHARPASQVDRLLHIMNELSRLFGLSDACALRETHGDTQTTTTSGGGRPASPAASPTTPLRCGAARVSSDIPSPATPAHPVVEAPASACGSIASTLRATFTVMCSRCATPISSSGSSSGDWPAVCVDDVQATVVRIRSSVHF